MCNELTTKLLSCWWRYGPRNTFTFGVLLWFGSCQIDLCSSTTTASTAGIWQSLKQQCKLWVDTPNEFFINNCTILKTKHNVNMDISYPSDSKNGVFRNCYANVMPADALAPCIYRPPTALNIHDKLKVVFHTGYAVDLLYELVSYIFLYLCTESTHA